MKAIRKKVLVILLSFSNLAVLGLVFYTYFDSQQPLFLLSTSESMDDLRKKVEKECRQYLQELIDGGRSSFICNIKVKQKQRGSSYTLRTKVTVIKTENGDFVIKGQGAMREKKRYATEADFCNDCSVEKNTVGKNGGLEEIMSQVVDVAEKFYEEARQSVQTAQKEYNKKDREKRIAKIKERRCEGRWNKADESFEDFDFEERLGCKMNRISELDMPLDIERFYHTDLKKDLWRTALSDDSYLLEDLDVLDKFDDPYRYSLSVRASAKLLKSYLGWKDNFESLNALPGKINFLKNIQPGVNKMTSFMPKDQAQQDLYYLNKGFDGLFVRLNQSTSALPRLSSPSTNPSPAGANTQPIITER